MSWIRNTRKDMEDPAAKMGFLLEAEASVRRGGKATDPILQMEADGQRQILNSDRLPTRIMGDRGKFEALGFQFGDPDPDDPMFMPATLPAGWKREGSEHAMWSYLVDETGTQRVAIFYKAAFYDRDAFMRLEQ